MRYIDTKAPGFTLIELLVVISIIGVLGMWIGASVAQARGNGRDARRAQDISGLQRALTMHLIQEGSFPVVSGEVALTGTDPVNTALVSKGYLKTAVTDPVSKRNVSCGTELCNYYYTSSGATYTLRYCREKSPGTGMPSCSYTVKP